jgi:hypothetical protein
MSDFLAQYWHKVSPEPNSGCWLWEGTVNHEGYGRIRIAPNKTTVVHRFAYELDRTQIPQGLQLDHLCRVRCCCNPDHLEPVTATENVRRAFAASPRRVVFKSGFCINGHRLSDEANYVHPTKGSIICRKCKRLANLRAQTISRANRKQSRN